MAPEILTFSEIIDHRSAHLLQMGTADIDLRCTLQRRQEDSDAIAIIATAQDHGMKATHGTIDYHNLITGSQRRFDGDDIQRIASPMSKILNDGVLNNCWTFTETHHVQDIRRISRRAELKRGIKPAEEVTREQRPDDGAPHPADHLLTFQTREIGFKSQGLIQVDDRLGLFQRLGVKTVPIHFMKRLLDELSKAAAIGMASPAKMAH